MTDAVAAYEEKARDLWLFDYPAQVSLCGTQVWWTTEVQLQLFIHGYDYSRT
jgi:dynein heavy chain